MRYPVELVVRDAQKAIQEGHILAWLISAETLDLFNGLTKTSIELDDGKTYPLVPFDLDDHLRLPGTTPK